MFDYPGIYKEANERSRGTQSTYLNLLRVFLFLLIVSTAMFSYFSEYWVVKLVNAIVSLGIVALSFLFSFVNFQGTWYSCRAVAESIKTISWRFSMRAEPYDIEDHEAKALFLKTVRQIVKMNHDFEKNIGAQFGTDSQVPNSMLQVRAKSLLERRQIYHQYRVIEQQNWYKGKSKKNKKMSWIFMGTLIVASLVLAALLFLSLRPEMDQIVLPVEFVLTVISVVFTWLQTKKYRELENSYALTAHEIGFISTQIDDIDSEVKLSEYVMNSENAFSREHTQWIARKDG